MLYSHYHKIESTPRFVQQRFYLASSPLPYPIWYTTRFVPWLIYLNHVSDTGFRKLYFHAVSNCFKHKLTPVISRKHVLVLARPELFYSRLKRG